MTSSELPDLSPKEAAQLLRDLAQGGEFSPSVRMAAEEYMEALYKSMPEFPAEPPPHMVQQAAHRMRIEQIYKQADDAATRLLAPEQDNEFSAFTEDDGSIDLRAIAKGLKDGSIEATRLDVSGLFSRGKINSIFGSSTAGKTWVALDVALRHFADTGERTLYIDAEDGPKGFATRALQMDEGLLDALVYFQVPNGVPDMEKLGDVIREGSIGVVVLDSLGEMLAGAGKDSNSEKDVTEWGAQVAKPLAALGPAVLLIDHVAKVQNGDPSQVGSFRKQALLSGNQYYVQSMTPFSRHQAGQSVLKVMKDRSGFFTRGDVAATYDFVPGGDGALDVLATIGADVNADAVNEQGHIEMRLNIMSEVQRWEDEEDPGTYANGTAKSPALGASLSSIRKYLKQTHGKNDNVRSDREVRWLVDNGYLTESTRGQGHFHRVEKPYLPEFEADV
jgi:hypothetical protein